MVVETPWFNRGRMGEYLLGCVEHRLCNLENCKDWDGLAKDALRAGLCESDVQDFLQQVREED